MFCTGSQLVIFVVILWTLILGFLCGRSWSESSSFFLATLLFGFGLFCWCLFYFFVFIIVTRLGAWTTSLYNLFTFIVIRRWWGRSCSSGGGRRGSCGPAPSNVLPPWCLTIFRNKALPAVTKLVYSVDLLRSGPDAHSVPLRGFRDLFWLGGLFRFLRFGLFFFLNGIDRSRFVFIFRTTTASLGLQSGSLFTWLFYIVWHIFLWNKGLLSGSETVLVAMAFSI